MQAATMRFHGDLNELLAPLNRQQQIALPSQDRRQSVKHSIEALGVPHTEVEWIVVDGRGVDFSHIVYVGQVIHVFPPGKRPEVEHLVALRPGLPRPTRFVLDNHLGRLARSMRLLGIDTLYFNNELDDERLAKKANEEGRVLLSRDRGLLKRSLVIHGYCLRTTDSKGQLRAVMDRFDLAEQVRPWTRCLRCNGLLRTATKEAVLEQLESRTRLYYDEFRRCTSCGQVYWQGSHFAQLVEIVDSILSD